MMSPKNTVSEIAQLLAEQVETVVKMLLPGGKREGHDWVVGSVSGEGGRSLKVCLTGQKAGVWADFATGEHRGDLVDLWRSVKGISMAEAITECKDYLDIVDKPKFYAPVQKTYKRPVKPKGMVIPKPEVSKVFKYLTEERKLTPETIKAFKVADQNGDIVFPYLRDGELIMLKYLKLDRPDGKKQIRVSPDSEPCLFGWQAIPDDARTISICEGEIDAMSLFQYGFPALSVPFGGGAGDKQRWIENEYDNLERFDRIYLNFDNDTEGEAGTLEVVKRLGAHRCWTVTSLEKDANQLLIAGAPKAAIQADYDNAKTPEWEPEQEIADTETSNTNLCIEDDLPLPISLDSGPVPELPDGLFTPAINNMLEAVSQATETPRELALMLMLAVLAACCQRRFVVSPTPGYVENLALWCIAALDSGNRKSAVVSALTKPLFDWELEQAEKLKEEIRIKTAKAKNIDARISAKRSQYAKTSSVQESEKLDKEILDLEKSRPEIPTLPRIWAQDITPEKIGAVMAETGESLAIISDEGGLMEAASGGRYNKGNSNLDILLQAHAGAAIRVDRVNRPPVFVRNPALTIGMSPQPDVVRDLSRKPEFRGRGLLARFLYMLPKSTLGYRSLEAKPVPESVKAAYESTIKALLETEPNE